MSKARVAILVISAVSLAMVMVVMMIMFVLAILDPAVDDDKVFAVIGPAFQMICGGFIGLITGINVSKTDNNEEGK
ncbi:MAG: hypothetical protein QX191_10725 [Methylococcaceae bacterium]|jgi:hypothetical protein